MAIAAPVNAGYKPDDTPHTGGPGDVVVSTKKPEWSAMAMVIGVLFLCGGIGLVMAGMASSAKAEAMEPEVDFQVVEDGCTVFGVEYTTKTETKSRCTDRRPNCSGSESKCCRTYVDEQVCVYNYKYHFIEGTCAECEFTWYAPPDTYYLPEFLSEETEVARTDTLVKEYDGYCDNSIISNPGDYGGEGQMYESCWQTAEEDGGAAVVEMGYTCNRKGIYDCLRLTNPQADKDALAFGGAAFTYGGYAILAIGLFLTTLGSPLGKSSGFCR
jgi:hypothetical protein